MISIIRRVFFFSMLTIYILRVPGWPRSSWQFAAIRPQKALWRGPRSFHLHPLIYYCASRCPFLFWQWQPVCVSSVESSVAARAARRPQIGSQGYVSYSFRLELWAARSGQSGTPVNSYNPPVIHDAPQEIMKNLLWDEIFHARPHMADHRQAPVRLLIIITIKCARTHYYGISNESTGRSTAPQRMCPWAALCFSLPSGPKQMPQHRWLYILLYYTGWHAMCALSGRRLRHGWRGRSSQGTIKPLFFFFFFCSPSTLIQRTSDAVQQQASLEAQASIMQRQQLQERQLREQQLQEQQIREQQQLQMKEQQQQYQQYLKQQEALAAGSNTGFPTSFAASRSQGLLPQHAVFMCALQVMQVDFCRQWQAWVTARTTVFRWRQEKSTCSRYPHSFSQCLYFLHFMNSDIELLFNLIENLFSFFCDFPVYIPSSECGPWQVSLKGLTQD